jgi:hypothetical protein
MKERVLACVLMLGMLSGCNPTTVQTEWKDPAYQGPGVRALVVLCLPADSKEKECEDEFVRQLGEEGVAATPGYRVAALGAGKEQVLAKTRELGITRVLVSRFMENKTQLDAYHRQTSMILMPDYDMWNNYQFVENQYLVFGTVLYDADSGKAIWSAVSDTFVKSSEHKSLKSYVQKMIKKMERQKLLAR